MDTPKDMGLSWDVAVDRHTKYYLELKQRYEKAGIDYHSTLDREQIELAISRTKESVR